MTLDKFNADQIARGSRVPGPRYSDYLEGYTPTRVLIGELFWIIVDALKAWVGLRPRRQEETT